VNKDLSPVFAKKAENLLDIEHDEHYAILFPVIPTNRPTMEQDPSRYMNSHSAGQEIPYSVWNLKIHYCVPTTGLQPEPEESSSYDQSVSQSSILLFIPSCTPSGLLNQQLTCSIKSIYYLFLGDGCLLAFLRCVVW
jgi:hypothetical protein